MVRRTAIAAEDSAACATGLESVPRPMILEHAGLDAFEPLLRKLHTLAFKGGIEALASRGLTMKDIERDQAAHSRFIRGCHQGYDRAQRGIALALIECERGERLLPWS